jgi:hypothetical protein
MGDRQHDTSVPQHHAVQLEQQPDPARPRAAIAEALIPIAGVPVGAHASLLNQMSTSRPMQVGLVARRLQRQYGNQYMQRVIARARHSEDAGAGDVSPDVESLIERERSAGQQLDHGVRANMEAAIGADFSGVRVHTGPQSDMLNQELSARAFTTGQDIFFRKGEYSPGSASGRELLAHELTHVVQQTGAVQTKLVVGSADDAYEREADQVAQTVMRQEQTSPTSPNSDVARRKSDDEDKDDQLQRKSTGAVIRRQGDRDEDELKKDIRKKPLAATRSVARRIQRVSDRSSDGDDWISLSVPDGPYVLDAANIPASANWALSYSSYVDVYATASQYDPLALNGLNADPHTLRHSRKGIDTDRNFRVKPGRDMVSEAGQGSAKVQGFRHNKVWDDDVIEARVRFDTVPLLEVAGAEEFVSGNVIDANPAHHEYVGPTEGTRVGRQETKTLTVSDGVTLNTSTTIGASVGAEMTDSLGLEIGLEGLGKLTAGSGTKFSTQASVSRTIGESRTKQITKSRQVQTTYNFESPGTYVIVPTMKVWKRPVRVNLFDDTGKKTGQTTAFLYILIYNETGSTGRAVDGKLDPSTVGKADPKKDGPKSVLDMSPDEFEKDKKAQHELFDMAKRCRDHQQQFAEKLLADQKIVGGEVKSILKRATFDEFVKGVIAKCRRNGYTRIGQMDDIVRGRFNLRVGSDVDTTAAAMKAQTQYPIKEIVAPRRPQPGGGFGYPRWHIILTDPDTGLTHEWQIGTKAVSEVFEKPGIKLPDGVKLGPGMHNDLHDIEYDIFKGIQKKYPDVHKRHGLPAFHSKVDTVAAEAGVKGDQTPELAKKIGALHHDAADHLQKLVDEFGAEWLKQFYH